MEKLNMSIREAERLGIMRQVDKKALTLQRASEELGISLRQAKRVRKRYKSEGEKGLVSKRRGMPSSNKTPVEIREGVIDLLATKYQGFGPTLAAEKLHEREGIKLSAETIRKWMSVDGLRKPKRRKEKRLYQRRMRRERFGELLQGDGSPHDWFEGRSEKCTLIQFVDDATSKVTAARFVLSETTDGYLDLLEEHLTRYGRPMGIYVDKHSVFRVNHKEVKNGTVLTHFGKVSKNLEIELICANSPQAKGRVERKNAVMQDRLTKEMRLRGINNLERANEYLPEFLEELNHRFGREASNEENAHRAMRKQDDLKRIFARTDTRKLSKELTFQYEGILYMIETKTPNRLKHATVEVIIKKGEAIEIEYEGKKLKYTKWSERPYEGTKILGAKEIELKSWADKTPKKTGLHHPWK